jgi:hypothetical protein
MPTFNELAVGGSDTPRTVDLADTPALRNEERASGGRSREDPTHVHERGKRRRTASTRGSAGRSADEEDLPLTEHPSDEETSEADMLGADDNASDPGSGPSDDATIIAQQHALLLDSSHGRMFLQMDRGGLLFSPSEAALAPASSSGSSSPTDREVEGTATAMETDTNQADNHG